MSTKQNTKEIPTWVLAYAAFLTLLGTVAAFIAYVMPQNMFLNVEADYGQIVAITSMFGARNVALAVIAGIALYTRDPKYLLIVFITRFLVELQDLIITVGTELTDMPALPLIVTWLIVFIIPQAMGINVLRKLVD